MMIQWRSKHDGQWGKWSSPENSDFTALGPPAAMAFKVSTTMTRVAFKVWDAVYEYRRAE